MKSDRTMNERRTPCRGYIYPLPSPMGDGETSCEQGGPMKKRIPPYLWHIGLFVATLWALWLLLVCAAAIPNGAIRANMERSALSYADRDPFAFTAGGKWNAVQDNYADAILLNVTWNMGVGNPLTATLDTGYHDGGNLGENAGLYLAVTQGAAPNTDYTRYWHGSALILRPLLLLIDAEGIKLLGLGEILALAAVTLALLLRRGHPELGLALALSLAAVGVWDLRLSLEYQPMFLLCFLLCPLYLLLERRGDRVLTLLSVAGGAAAAFFDFLTTETVTIVLPLLLLVAVRTKEGRLGGFRKGLGLSLRCGGSWLAAYGGAFLVKWTAATLATGENKFAAALASVAERVGVAPALGDEAPATVFSAVAANLTALFGGTARAEPGRVALGLALTALILGSVYYLFRAKKKRREGALLLLLLGGVVFARFLVLNNHSYLHAFFTYRALICPIFALLAALFLNVAAPWRKGAG